MKTWYDKARVTSYDLRLASYKLLVESLKAQVEIWKCKIKYTSYEFKFMSYEFKSTSSRIIQSVKTQVNSLKISSFPKILSHQSLSTWWGNSSVSGDNLVFFFPTTSWLQIQQETMWVNNNLNFHLIY